MRFSIIIPLYNKAPYIKKALDSVISQTFKDYELIVVDDGSVDESYEVAREFLERLGIIYNLIRQPNSGVSMARNLGASLSAGDYLCFLDADDWWAPNFLEKMNEFIREYPEAGIYGTNYFYIKNGRQRVCVTNAKTGYIDYCKTYVEKLQMPLWTGAVCLSRTIFKEFGGFKPHLCLGEDFDLWIRIALKYKVAFLNEPLSYYCQDSNPKWRLVGKLHDPSRHILWNIDYLSEEEKKNPDYKLLIDSLRAYSLLPYYLSKQYNIAAKTELAKIDWSQLPKSEHLKYSQPLFLLKVKMRFRKIGSIIKQWLIKHL